ncbi:MAG TPA: hypothetical protein VMZ71_03590, partial [Gemmataceae bacterium]|nr:hypothetical protein [Gemmataceae bacterium]
AAWAPVYVELEMLLDVKEPAELVIESPDADEVTTVLSIPLHLADAKPGQALSARDMGQLPYVRPSASGETTFTVRAANGTALSEPFRVRSLRPKDTLTYVVLSLGGRLPGFDLPKPTTATDQSAGLRGGRIELASIGDVSLMPDQWFGYEAADLVVLTTGTGSDAFLQRLFGDSSSASDKTKRAALLEWVRRGGRVVVSVGSNAGLAVQYPALQEFLPFAVKPEAPGRTVPTLPLNWSGRDNQPLTSALTPRGGTVPLANLVPKPARPSRVLIPPPGRSGEDKETVVAQAAFGLGRVTVIGFDIDRSPFTEMGLRPEFWDWVLRECGASRASIGNDGKPRDYTSGVTENEDELAAALRTHVDTFDGVPVISFGWVAIFIVLYILLIGPVEYFFLKRVLGRLELTWVTFPIIVLTVSAAAYFTAYAVKGRDLKINKVDVVEIDPASGRVYGTTWFTIFSPRIDTYTAGVTPGEGWGVESPDTPALVGWVGGPRGGRSSIVRRRYAYHTGPNTVADGLDGVPIQVWSTKSLTANWTAAIDPASPVVESKLLHPPGDPTRVIGTFTNRMPFPEVRDCVAFYAGTAYEIGNILKGDEVRLVLDKGQPAAQWLQTNADMPGVLARQQQAASQSRYGARTNTGGSTLPLWGVLFHEAALRNDEGVLPRNSSLRRLDQTWRLAADNRDEVVVVGRVLPSPGKADVLSGPQSPTRLWLKGLPGGGRPAVPIPGTARQETYVRIYLPIKK